MFVILVSMETNRKHKADRTEIQSIIIGKLMNLSGILNRESNSILSPYDLNQQQFSVLFEITKAGEVQQKNMVNRLLLEKAHVSKVVKKLQAMRLIKITPMNEDKRSALLSPTKKGLEIVSRCRALFDEWKNESLSQFNEDELLQIMENVEKLQKAFLKQ